MTTPHKHHRLGRPLLGDEPCDKRVTALVTESTYRRLLAKTGSGSVSDTVRKIVERYFREAAAPKSRRGRPAARPKKGARKVRGRGRRVRRYRDQGK